MAKKNFEKQGVEELFLTSNKNDSKPTKEVKNESSISAHTDNSNKAESNNQSSNNDFIENAFSSETKRSARKQILIKKATDEGLKALALTSNRSGNEIINQLVEKYVKTQLKRNNDALTIFKGMHQSNN